MVAPADGYIIYIRQLKDLDQYESVKKGEKIILEELKSQDYDLLIGIFMTPLSVHYNRYPHAGQIKNIYYRQVKANLPMMKAFLNLVFNLKPYTEGADYILENERNVILLSSQHIESATVQIADKWVNKIDYYGQQNEQVKKGEKLGLIRMGSQCDLYLKIKGNYQIKVKERDYVKAGETILIDRD
ncbi:MAG: phosphatidylserine decarboxylase [Spirochaetes bacterium]|nr:phosphatidylserine decarboxylase [Spirochaetota bacterium]